MSHDVTTSKKFTPDWINWLTINVNNGQDKNGLFKILLDEGFSFNDIVTQMNYQPNIKQSQLVNPFDANRQKTQLNTATRNTSYNGAPPNSQPIFSVNALQFNNNNLELYLIEDFLNEAECAKIISLITSKLRPSELTSPEADQTYRTSRTCDLGDLNDEFMTAIDSKICKLIGIDESYSEVVQGQYYEIGQQFKAHTDYFEKNEIAKYGGKMGQRTYTVMIFLNNVEEGGETHFVNVDESIKPKLGMAIVWNSLYHSGETNSFSMHCGMPVIKGYKAIITKWFRSNSHLDNAPAMFTKQ